MTSEHLFETQLHQSFGKVPDSINIQIGYFFYSVSSNWG